MRKRSSKTVKPKQEPPKSEAVDAEAAEPSAAPPEKNAAAVELGRLGGKKGGPARAKKLTKEQRSDIAKKAAQARWANKKDS